MQRPFTPFHVTHAPGVYGYSNTSPPVPQQAQETTRLPTQPVLQNNNRQLLIQSILTVISTNGTKTSFVRDLWSMTWNDFYAKRVVCHGYMLY